MSVIFTIVILLGVLSIARTFPPEPVYCTESGGNFAAIFIFDPSAPEKVSILYFLLVDLDLIVNGTGVIPWTVDCEHRNLYLDIKDKTSLISQRSCISNRPSGG
ncbi:hypothetical protein Pmar_PMAR028021 [Perkinsus marinus ATCC 50983]|uniref:Uncharacterized protein n=1 Tax=Perkinsus marinus (strain ATCC 50983 / TXsc) TaxID=423536 RepID=C5LVC0_PERM5|nr:hypothetical protein Pmar_PMAR028021 [Perkinsus marinus ATCC 50983]EEQ99358.1 hypothetical protein Pmar_PMAR028021 [Perkinsus marinus ATCC 50983]|eukprot:XP_002766641.1 hypothetical protein Pmar_PMAR028021 [Perkinsus marinus ATCC 50983]